jgi:hypothetical protein
MASADAENFRLAVLNPGGRDPEQHFPSGADVPDNQHAPVNFHAYAACTRGAVFREIRQASETGWPVLVLLRGDFRATEKSLRQLKRRGCVVAVAFKESGAHQIAQQLSDAARLARFAKIVSEADGCIASTPETAELFLAFRKEGVAFVPTPYPIEAQKWNFSTEERSGIFVGTRELDVPSRHHLAALLAAKRLSLASNEPVTVYNFDRRKGQRLIAQIGFPRISVHEKRIRYGAYLRQLAAHKIVFQLDRSRVPGQVAGDTILARGVCVGGDGAMERIAFPETCGEKRSDTELIEIALKLLDNHEERRAVAERATKIAQEKLSFRAGRKNLARFFAQLG